MGDDSTAALGALRVDEQKLTGHVNEVVRSSVEATLNGMLDGGGSVGRSVTSARRSGWIVVPVTTSVSSRRRRAK
jgi:hypothetical protein